MPFYPVEMLCEVLEVSRSGYYAWTKRKPPERAKRDAELSADIAAVYKSSRGTYGSPRVHVELRARGKRVGKKRVERLMREHGLVARQKRRFRRTTDSNHALPVAPNVLDRKFETKAPNQAWVTDVTYIATDEGWMDVPGGHPRPVLAPRSRLGHERHQRPRPSPRRARARSVHGAPSPASSITLTAAVPMPATTTARRSPVAASSPA